MIADPDLAYLRLAVQDLQDYLHSPELFWPLPSAPTSLGEPGLQQLTICGLALSLARVTAAGLPEAGGLGDVIADTRNRWRATWITKAAREYRSRVELWRRAIDDLLGEPSGRKTAYPSRVRVRVMLDLLVGEMTPEHPPEAPGLAILDGRLRAATTPGNFVWETCFSQAFPKIFTGTSIFNSVNHSNRQVSMPTNFYTRTGDDGMTGLLGEGRVSKGDVRIEALGAVDEVTAALGMARAVCQSAEAAECLVHIQRDLYGLMGEVAATPENVDKFRVIGC